MEPILSQSACHGLQVQCLKPRSFVLAEVMALHTRQAVTSNQQSAAALHAVDRFFKRHLRDFFSAICLRERIDDGSNMFRTKLRHTRQHVRPIVGPVVHDVFKPRRIQLVADPIQRRRDAAFVTHFRDGCLEVIVANTFDSADFVPSMTRVAVERQHGAGDRRSSR